MLVNLALVLLAVLCFVLFVLLVLVVLYDTMQVLARFYLILPPFLPYSCHCSTPLWRHSTRVFHLSAAILPP